MPEIVGNISDRLYSDDQETAYRIIETLLMGEIIRKLLIPPLHYQLRYYRLKVRI